jgi:murein DD-endopeptidase MepM/ murein hydrolase activator NlpD
MSRYRCFTQLFPSLASAPWLQVDINREAARHLAQNGTDDAARTSTCFLSAEGAGALLERIHRRERVQYSFGGYLENRSTFLKDSYLEKDGNFLHLGIDFTVPAGTQVAALVSGVVLNVFDNQDLEHGWGPRVTIGISAPGTIAALVFGHLDRIKIAEGDVVKAATIIGTIGTPPENGNWWPHLHLQALSPQALAHHSQNNFQTIDGYGNPSQLESLQAEYPDPMIALF